MIGRLLRSCGKGQRSSTSNGGAMPSLSDATDSFVKIVQLVGITTSSALLSSIGVFLVLVAAVVAIVAVTKPASMQPWLKWVLFLALIGGMAFSIAGPSLALLNITENVIPRVSKEEAFKRLADNEKTGWLIRLISFDPKREPQLAIDQLRTLGSEAQKYAFVAPYDELRGVSVKDSVARVGGNYSEGRHVSAIIFPLQTGDDRDVLYPANARGLLQVVGAVEDQLSEGKFLLKNIEALERNEHEDMKETHIWSWRFSQYKDKYKKYCRLAQTFRCDRTYTARSFIGDLNQDWHPLGLSQAVEGNPCALMAPDYCASDDWETLKKSAYQKFGSRVFLFRNRELKDLPGRIMIDFTKGSEVIPDIGLSR